MADRWLRDPGISEIIEYFDQPAKSGWERLKPEELDVIFEQIKKCAQSFEYAARNYFWITDKDKRDIPFRLWESQELILAELYKLKAAGKAMKLMILKARQLGCSTLVEGYLAWMAMFSINSNSLIVSYNPGHAQALFSIILHIVDRMPWWLKPMEYTRKYEEGLHFLNPDVEMRKVKPGLNSRVLVQAANQYSGVGEGYRINGTHVSEYGMYDPARAQAIISGELRWSLVDSPETCAVLESTAKRTSWFTEKLWEAESSLGDMASWKPLFLPVFMERTRFISPETGWAAEEPELEMQKRAAEEWNVCDSCGQIRPAVFGGELTLGVLCADCKKGTYRSYALSNGQMRWMWQQRINAERLGAESIKELRQNLASNPQEAFQLAGDSVFSQVSRDFVSRSVRIEPKATGSFDSKGIFHAPRIDETGRTKQEIELCWAVGCKVNHKGEPNRYLRVWEMPARGARYVVGVDVSEGLGGDHDYSVAWVNRIGVPPMPDVHVATYRSNTTDAYHMADVVNALGRWYNDALVSVEYNTYQTVGDRLRMFFQYPNIFRWKHPDAENVMTSRFHWVTRVNTKDLLWQTAEGWLKDGAWIVKDPIFAHEMRHFEWSPNGSGGAGGEHDDVVMAACIALVTSHDLDYSRAVRFQRPDTEEPLKDPKEWEMSCLSCKVAWFQHSPAERNRCPYCASIMIKGHRAMPVTGPVVDFEEMGVKNNRELEMVEY